jgi:hypothetical protein
VLRTTYCSRPTARGDVGGDTEVDTASPADDPALDATLIGDQHEAVGWAVAML